MNYRKLGNTGLMVSEIGLGCEGFSENNYQNAKVLLDAAEEYGINYFDLYASDPQVRASVGDALIGRREKFILQSHVCSVWKDGQYKRTRNITEVKEGKGSTAGWGKLKSGAGWISLDFATRLV